MNVKSVISIVVCLISFSSISQQLNRMLLENWSNGAWENRMQRLPFYDEDGRLVRNEIAHWDAELKVWKDQTKTVFNRDENGNLLNREIFNWLEDQLVWEATIRASYSINDKNKPSSVLNEVRGKEGWYNKSIDEYKYDANENLLEKRSERWNKQLTAWVPEWKYNYVIDSDRTVGYTVNFWDNKVGEWQAYKKAVYHFSKDETIDHISIETWKEGSWKHYSVRRNFHDEEGVLNTTEVDKFDLTSETWLKGSHVEYELTDFDEISESINKKWNDGSSNWENLQRSTFYYLKDGKMIEEWSQDTRKMELFPNPAMESVTIRSIPVGTITIVDALGKIVFHTEDNEDETMQLDVSKWEIGVYSVRVDGSEIQKFAKQ